MTNEKEFLNLSEAALLLGRSLNTVRKWVESGELPVKKIGRCYIVSKEALRAWVATK